MKKLLDRLIVMGLVICALVSSAPVAAKSGPSLGAEEVKLGKKGAAEIAKENKLSDNAKDLAHLREIGQKIAAVANKQEIPALYGVSRVTPFEYTFDIVEDKDVNAFSLPGGHIYVNRGLLDYVQSDHELAAVLAHEITHASHHHMVYLISKQEGMGPLGIALLAAMLVGAKGSDMSNVLLGVQLLQIARLNGYGMQAERDSDVGSIYYMREAGYNPVGMLTFMERLAKKGELIDYGIYRSHPLDADRVQAAKKMLIDLKIPIKRRATTNAAKAEVKADKLDGKDTPSVYIKDKLIYRPAPSDGRTSAQLANDVANQINKMLDAGLQLHEVRSQVAVAGVTLKNQALVAVSDEDARLMGRSPADVAQGIGDAIKAVIWQQLVDTIH